MFDSLLASVLLPLGLALGWYIGRNLPRSGGATRAPGSNRVGTAATAVQKTSLGQLVDDDPDAAIAALLRAAELDVETIELQLTLGKLFRRRGEVDRSLRIHESLLAREGLDLPLRREVVFELAADYAKAGVIDRAEDLYEQLVAQGAHVVPSLEALREIAETGHEWQTAYDVNERLEAASGAAKPVHAAQYLCEQAELARRGGDPDTAIRLCQRALRRHPACVRANLLLGAIEEARQRFPVAIERYEETLEQDPRFVAEIVEPLWRCRQATGEFEAYLAFLQQAGEQTQSSAVVLKQYELRRETSMDATAYLARAFERRPGWRLLAALVEALDLPPGHPMAGAASSLREALQKAAKTRPRYRCTQCGLQPGVLLWHCPSCRHWETVTPVDDYLDVPD